MKVFALIALFVACASSSAVWPYAPSAPWAYSAYSHAPITQYSSYPAYYAHAPAVSYANHVAAPYVASPYVAAPYVHAPVVAAIPHTATYTAANKGSVHTAPLPGHAVSQTSLNLAPAPGTH
ncbi:hypothetical protein ACKWTF_008145 [Chironomus riparius]